MSLKQGERVPFLRLGKLRKKECVKEHLLSKAEVEDIMSDMQTKSSGRLRRAACGGFGPGHS